MVRRSSGRCSSKIPRGEEGRQALGCLGYLRFLPALFLSFRDPHRAALCLAPIVNSAPEHSGSVAEFTIGGRLRRRPVRVGHTSGMRVYLGADHGI